MGLFKSIGKVLKGAVSVLSKVADIVAPICAFIPGLNPVVTAVAAGIKAIDGLTDKPPNLGKVLGGVVSMIPGGALAKVLGPLAKLGGGTAGKFAEMFVGAAAGKSGTGGLLGDVLKSVVGSKAIGGPDSPLGGFATQLFGSFADKLRTGPFQSSLTDLVTRLTGTKAGDVLSAEQIAKALTQPTGGTVTRLIDGSAQPVPELRVHPELDKLISSALGQVAADAGRQRSEFVVAPRPLVEL